MARPPRLHFPGAFVHVMQRGNDRRAIFLDDQDRTRYLGLLGRALPECGVKLHAYCLLSNHVHLLLQPEDRPLADLMHPLGSQYARCFNERWAHSGHLFQGRFVSVWIKDERQFLATVRYIHLNPSEAGLVADPAHHRWSSHRAYLGGPTPSWLETAHVRGLLGATPAAAVAAYAELMGEEVDGEVIRPSELAAPVSAAAGERLVSLDRILEEIAARSGCSVAEICNGSGHAIADARYAVVLLARTLTRMRLSELADVLDRTPATLCNGLARRLDRPTPGWRELVEGARLSLMSKKEKESAWHPPTTEYPPTTE